MLPIRKSVIVVTHHNENSEHFADLIYLVKSDGIERYEDYEDFKRSSSRNAVAM